MNVGSQIKNIFLLLLILIITVPVINAHYRFPGCHPIDSSKISTLKQKNLLIEDDSLQLKFFLFQKGDNNSITILSERQTASNSFSKDSIDKKNRNQIKISQKGKSNIILISSP